MLYGYLPAIITGFLLTAIPNWTGRLPLQGKPLALLVAVWIAGRVAIGFSAVIGPLAAGSIDILFLLLLVFATTREVVIGRNWRNLPPVVIVLALLFRQRDLPPRGLRNGNAGTARALASRPP